MPLMPMPPMPTKWIVPMSREAPSCGVLPRQRMPVVAARGFGDEIGKPCRGIGPADAMRGRCCGGEPLGRMQQRRQLGGETLGREFRFPA